MKRKLGLILVFLAGWGLLVYGLAYHRITIEEAKQREVSVAVATLPGVGDMQPEGGSDAEPAAPEETPKDADDGDPFRTPAAKGTADANAENPFESHAAPPAPANVKYEKVTENYIDVHAEPEWAIVRDVTVGGVVLLANGHLKRTYSGQPPALCPT
jgi:hypothetical protein